MMTDQQPAQQGSADPLGLPPHMQPRIVPSTELLRGKSEVWIEHLGQVYRLRQTRSGKLILQK